MIMMIVSSLKEWQILDTDMTERIFDGNIYKKRQQSDNPPFQLLM